MESNHRLWFFRPVRQPCTSSSHINEGLSIYTYNLNTKEMCATTPLELNHPFICVFETNDMHHTPTESNVSFSLLWWARLDLNQQCVKRLIYSQVGLPIFLLTHINASSQVPLRILYGVSVCTYGENYLLVSSHLVPSSGGLYRSRTDGLILARDAFSQLN